MRRSRVRIPKAALWKPQDLLITDSGLAPDDIAAIEAAGTDVITV
ncbi:hypothetical protein AB0C89_09600 [Streptomyces sp. NPDC048491]